MNINPAEGLSQVPCAQGAQGATQRLAGAPVDLPAWLAIPGLVATLLI